MKLEYDIVEAYSHADMLKEMHKALRAGWSCQGGLCVTPFAENKTNNPHFEGLIFHQAIIREFKENKSKKAVGF